MESLGAPRRLTRRLRLRPLHRLAERLRLDRQRAVIGGVCAGMADYFGWDVALVRIAWVLATIFFFGSLLLVYPIIWAIAD